MSHETADRLLDFVERYVMTRLYRTVFCPPTSDDEDRDLAIQDRIRSLHWINTFLLDIALDETDDSMRKLVDQAITGRGKKYHLCYSEQSLSNLHDHSVNHNSVKQITKTRIFQNI